MIDWYIDQFIISITIVVLFEILAVSGIVYTNRILTEIEANS